MEGTQAVSHTVSSFFARLGDTVDEEVAEYLTATVAETDEDTDPVELCQLIAAFSPIFSHLKEETQLAEVLQLMTVAQEAVLSAPQPGEHADEVGERRAARAESNLSARDDTASSLVAEDTGQPDEDEKVTTLLGLCPEGVSREYVQHVLWNSFGGDIELAAQWVLETDVVAKARAREAALQKEATRREMERREWAKERKQLAKRFQFQKVREGAPVRMWEPATAQQSRTMQVRYHNNAVVSRRGEKYVTQSLREEWNGGSTGKVYTKGKRGKGFV